MRRSVVIYFAAVVFALIFAADVQAVPTTYSGSLSSTDSGLLVNGDWSNGEVLLEWTVSENVNNSGVVTSWHYKYTLTVPVGFGGNISHFTVERSDVSVAGEFFGFGAIIDDSNLPGEQTVIEIQDFTEGPESFPGIKLENSDGDLGRVLVFEFDSLRIPKWGDFYTKDGKAGSQGLNEAWNKGFTNPDIDPPLDAPLSDGSLDYHLIVPDSGTIPSPGAILLGGIGTGFVGWLRRRRTI